MKPETKMKLLKAAKLAAYIVLGGFATLGVAASMICLTQCTAKKPEIETSVSASSPRGLKPKRSIVNNRVVRGGTYKWYNVAYTPTPSHSSEINCSISYLTITTPTMGSLSPTSLVSYNVNSAQLRLTYSSATPRINLNFYPSGNSNKTSITTWPEGGGFGDNVTTTGDTGYTFYFSQDFTIPSGNGGDLLVSMFNTQLVLVAYNPTTDVDVSIDVSNGAIKPSLTDDDTFTSYHENYDHEANNVAFYVVPLAGHKVPSSVFPTSNSAGVSWHWSVADDYGLLTFSVEEDSTGSFVVLITMPLNDAEGVEETTRLDISGGYDFRKWIGDVDPSTGLMHIRVNDLGGTGDSVALSFGGAEFRLVGNERVYNFVQLVVVNITSSGRAFLYGDGESAVALSATDLYGARWNEYSYLAYVYFGYKTGYVGDKVIGTLPLDDYYDYKDTIYNGNVAYSAKGTSGTYLACSDVRNVRVPYLYRSFTIEEDSGLRLDIPNMPQTTLVEAFKADLFSEEIKGIGNGDVFGMFSNAFTAVGGILSVEILPHLSVGVLLFLPLVVIIIVAIVKVLNK